ncbi:alpha-1,3-arabinosyltransferase XAT3 isoform X2 [Elaeis guineensis]|uniref:Alpha-1,3-arabinosyltransferase XAT3 isoform X2 n=1 Tax=Elaeis guineensis var. tenera TaxID=51953 RepID=A0A6I9R156_ELAGV|nr:alpha-1,3-arabinosyltransferase XAT3 isoform X2 [Elaeis guineensis]
MANKMKLARNSNRESHRFRLVVFVIGCFLVSMTFIVVSQPQSIPFPILGLKPRVHVAPSTPKAEQTTHSQQPGGVSGQNNATEQSKQEIGRDNETQERSMKADDPRTHQDEVGGEINSAQKETFPSTTDKLGVGDQKMNSERKPLCDFSHYRVNRCEMEGDIRIHRNPSSIISVESTERSSESYRIRPYPRKGDKIALSRVTEVIVKSSKEGPQCSINHDVPALVFSVGGYTGNLFHDFTDVMLPIFLSASQYNGEVQFVITETRPWWMHKYVPVFRKLSRYEIIDFDNDDRVHCFKHAVVGLRAQMEFSVDPSQDPNGYSMVDFGRFMRSVYSLERDTMTKIEEHPHRKPRLAIISRQRTRKFTNIPEIVQMARDLGYEVVVEEAGISTNVSQFAEVINSCDVLMGVHGAGLTNLVFLPINATIIQIVPWGGLEGIAMFDFGHGAKAMKLNYVQYSINVDESTLTEIYPRDHLVFQNPMSFHRKGWELLRGTFMDKQNVKLDVNRFRDVLWKALEHMMQ